MKYIFLSLVLFSFMSCGKSGGSSAHTVPGNQSITDSVTEEYMQLVNDYRRDQGANPLIYSGVMEISAEGHSQNMASGAVAFSHTGSSARCDVIENKLGGGNLCGEIIAMGQKTAKDAFTSWINSSGHRSIMINPRYTHTGLGYARGKDGTMYWTQIYLEM